MTPLLWVLAAGVAAALAALGWRVARFWPRRRLEWEHAASMLGLTLVAGPPLHERFSYLEYFQRGTQRRTRVLLEGEGWRGRVVMGDHVFTIGSGNSRSQHRHTVCLVSSPRLRLPDFSLRRENALLDRVAELFGGQDIDFEEDFDFSRAYRLRGSDEAKVRALFSAAVRHFLLHDVGRRIAVEGRNDTLLVHMGKLLRPQEARTLLHTTQELAQLLGA